MVVQNDIKYRDWYCGRWLDADMHHHVGQNEGKVRFDVFSHQNNIDVMFLRHRGEQWYHPVMAVVESCSKISLHRSKVGGDDSMSAFINFGPANDLFSIAYSWPQRHQLVWSLVGQYIPGEQSLSNSLMTFKSTKSSTLQKQFFPKTAQSRSKCFGVTSSFMCIHHDSDFCLIINSQRWSAHFPLNSWPNSSRETFLC